MRIKMVKCMNIDELSTIENRRNSDINYDWWESTIENRRNSDINYDWWESTIENFCETTAPEKGFDVDPETVMFDLYCQGSGASFGGNVDEDKILKLLDPDAKLYPAVHLIIDEISININRSGRYFHDGTMDVNIDNYNEDEGEDDLAMTIAVAQTGVSMEDQVEAFGDAVLEEARELARKLHYTLNDEYILEDLRANEVEFEEGEVTVAYDHIKDKKIHEFVKDEVKQ